MNLRPAYLVLMLGLLVLAAWQTPAPRGPLSVARRALSTVAVLAGMLVIFVPQSLITHHNHQLWSPLPGAAAKLDSFQLTVGLRLQLYNTYVGTDRVPQMNFEDPAGAALINDAKLDASGYVDGLGAYARLGLGHPVALTGVLARHLVNGIDQRYSTPYPSDLDNGERRPWRLLGILLFFAAGVRLLWPAARRSLGPARWRYLVVIGLGVLTILPSAVEQRFMLPLFTVAVLLVVAPGWPSPLANPDGVEGWRRFRTPVVLAVSLAIVLVILLTVSSATTRHLVQPLTAIAPNGGAVGDLKSLALRS